MVSRRPIVLVTGANGGVGYGICERLLLQLSQSHPPDATPAFQHILPPDLVDAAESQSYAGLTLILACRSSKRAESARTTLLARLDTEIIERAKLHGRDDHAESFRQNVQIDIISLDLAQLSSVFNASSELSQRYPYISHLICNAGVISVSGIHWLTAVLQILKGPILAVSNPKFNIHNVGERSADGLGWVWQCNIFSHYALFRSIEHLLNATPVKVPELGAGRVIWMSSLESSPDDYDPSDFQLLKTKHNYALSKFQTDLLATRLDILAQEADAKTGSNQQDGRAATRHFVSQPGVVATSIFSGALNWFTAWAMLMAFHIAKLLGSPHHTIEPSIAAASFVHLCLAPLGVIDAYRRLFADPKMEGEWRHAKLAYDTTTHKFTTPAAKQATKEATVLRPCRFGSETDGQGKEKLGMTEVREWDAFEQESQELVARMDQLLRDMKSAEEEGRTRSERVEGFKGMGSGDGGKTGPVRKEAGAKGDGMAI